MKSTKTYIPQTGIEYPADPFTSTVAASVETRQIAFDETYPYHDDSFDYKWNTFLCYAGLWTVGFLLNRIKYGLRIEGRKNFTSNRKLFREKGGISICNHVYRWDAVSILDVLRFRSMKLPVLNQHLLGKDHWFIRSIGGIALPDDIGGLKKFNEAMDRYAAEGRWIHVFPEARRWEFYAPIRPFKIGAFNMAWKYDRPILPLAISYRERKGIYKYLGKKSDPLITIHVGTPVIPDKSVSRKEDTNRMREEAHAQMVKMVGMENNPWPAAID